MEILSKQEIALQQLIKPIILNKQRVVWNSLTIKDYFEFAQTRVNELELKSVAEYCIYICQLMEIYLTVCVNVVKSNHS